MSGATAFLFPGQGAQQPGMGQALCRASSEAAAVFAAADRVLGFSLSRLCFDGPAEELERTAITQPAVLTVSIAAWRALVAAGAPEPSLVAGHSLGEYAALVAAGAIAFEDAVRLVHLRGRFMQEAVPQGEGAMAVVIGLANEEIVSLCGKLEGCWPANWNGAGQVVVAGRAQAVAAASRLAEERGAKLVKQLSVSAPFHCPLMAPAAERLARELERVGIRDARVPVLSNVEAAPYREAVRVRQLLVRQVTEPVRWQESVEALACQGITRTIELGPGRVLSGMVRRIAPAIKVTNIERPEQVAVALEVMHG